MHQTLRCMILCLLASVISVQTSKHDVLIIGAGASGYAAGCRLLENNFTNFIILEASERIGGRVHSIHFGRDKIDLGGQWIHGQVGNIVYETAEKYDLVYNPSGIKSVVNYTTYQSDGKKYGTDLFSNLLQFINNTFHEDTSNVTGSQGDYFTSRFWQTFGDDFKEKNITTSESTGILRLVELMDNSMEGSPSWYDTALNSDYEDYPGAFDIVWKFGGYSTVFDLLSKKIPDPNKKLEIDERVYLRKKVTGVDWSGDHVDVTCEDGTRFSADQVLTTVSLGVLKADANRIFQPALPSSHLHAIEGLGMGTVNKIFLEFPYRWWEPSTTGLALTWRQQDIDQLPEELKWTAGVFAFNAEDNFPLNLLCGWISGRAAETIETIPEDIVKQELVTLLKRFVGNSVHVPDPVSIIRSKWFNDPYTRGSYSYVPVGSHSKNATNLQLSKPVKNHHGVNALRFAGEATNNLHHSTVHGAIESGIREADKILLDISTARKP